MSDYPFTDVDIPERYRPVHPEPPSDRIEAAALHIAEQLAGDGLGGHYRQLRGGEWELDLHYLADLNRDRRNDYLGRLAHGGRRTTDLPSLRRRPVR